MRSAEAKVVAKDLEKLNTTDFSSCLKGEKLETGVAHVIDYACYLQILLRDSDSTQGTASKMTEHNGADGHGERLFPNAAFNSVDYKYSKLQEQYRLVCAQKVSVSTKKLKCRPGPNFITLLKRKYYLTVFC